MNYELAKELNEAGFPQGEELRCRCSWPDQRNASGASVYEHNPVEQQVYVPTLEELIEACGEKFVELRNFRHEMWRLYNRKTAGEMLKEYYDDLPNGDWIAGSTVSQTADEGTVSFISGEGKTLEEAVAKLWLALNKK